MSAKAVVRHVQFDLGPIVATPGALEALQRNNTTGMELVRRHAKGDWGELGEEDRQTNLAALESGAPLMSVYTLDDGTKLYVITDAVIDAHHHRQATTLLLPEEY